MRHVREPTVSKFTGDVLDSEKLAASVPDSDKVPENAGDDGDIGTVMEPMRVPPGEPMLNDKPLMVMPEMVWAAGVHVIVTAWVKGDPVAPACVATIFNEYVVQAREPLVSSWDGSVVLDRKKLPAFAPVRDSVPENAGVVGDMLTETLPTNVLGGAPELNDELSSDTADIVCAGGVQVTVTGSVTGELPMPDCVATTLRL